MFFIFNKQLSIYIYIYIYILFISSYISQFVFCCFVAHFILLHVVVARGTRAIGQHRKGQSCFYPCVVAARAPPARACVAVIRFCEPHRWGSRIRGGTRLNIVRQEGGQIDTPKSNLMFLGFFIKLKAYISAACRTRLAEPGRKGGKWIPPK